MDPAAMDGKDENGKAKPQRLKSSLTTMLAAEPDTVRCFEVFAAVPRKAGDAPERKPQVTLPISSGMDWYQVLALVVAQELVKAYVVIVVFSLCFTFANMLGGQCGQETWKTSGEEACTAGIKNCFALGLELRCLSGKPPNMAQEDFDGVCGAYAYIGFYMGVGFTLASFSYNLYLSLGKLDSKVHFYENLLTVESWSGKHFKCTFYDDVTAAKVSAMKGMVVSTAAKVSLLAGGADEDGEVKGKGKQLTIRGERNFTILAGGGEAKQTLLEEFAKHLPVGIEGFTSASAVVPVRGSGSMLDTRLAELLKVRTNESTEFDVVRKPFTCDFWTDGVVLFIIILLLWYIPTTFFNFIFWGLGRAQGKCMDPMKPGVDMCAVWRIFMPLNLPIVNPSDYINVLLLIVPVIGVPLYHISNFPMAYRFHKLGAIQEVLLAGWESQNNVVVFASDIVEIKEAANWVEKYAQVKVKASYTIQGGISKPFHIVAKFMPHELKMLFVDATCASCSGQRELATIHREALLQNLDKLKPGLLPAPDPQE